MAVGVELLTATCSMGDCVSVNVALIVLVGIGVLVAVAVAVGAVVGVRVGVFVGVLVGVAVFVGVKVGVKVGGVTPGGTGDGVRVAGGVCVADAAWFANQVSVHLNLPTCYDCDDDFPNATCDPIPDFETCTGFRLPTEAEWEWAARGGEDFAFAGSDFADDVGWFGLSIHEPVATKPPNGFGLYDMTSGVHEWVHDRYALYPTTPQTDPYGPTTGVQYVVRGGGYGSSNRLPARNAARTMVLPTLRSVIGGFRLVRTP